MLHALTDAQLKLLRLALVGDLPMPRELRHEAYFADVDLLALVGLMEPRGDWFALTARGAIYLDLVRRADPSCELGL